MNVKLRRFNSFLTLLIIIFISLSIWQYKRFNEKKNFIANIYHNIQTQPSSYEAGTELIAYKKLLIKGKFLSGQTRFLYGRRSMYPEKDGYYILSVFLTENNERLLVSRGWLAHSDKESAQEFFDHEIEDEIETIVMKGEKKNFLMPDNDEAKKIWFYIDLDSAKEKLNITNSDYYFMQIDSKSLPVMAKKLNLNKLGNVRNDHLEYCLTWLSFAMIGFIYIVIYNKKNKLL